MCILDVLLGGYWIKQLIKMHWYDFEHENNDSSLWGCCYYNKAHDFKTQIRHPKFKK
jgi:hypothetical protein